jgi:hemerythrin
MSIKWTPALAVGVSAIDQQHQELFDRVAKLIDAMKNSDAAEVGRLMDFLGAYVVEHFRMEEGLMQRYAYPDYALHKAAHERFVQDYGELRRKFESKGAMSFVTIQVKTWLVDWLTAHVQGTDLSLGRWLQRRVRERQPAHAG